MILALAALLGAALTVAACYAAGAMLLDRLGIQLRRYERLPLAFTLGAACLHLAIFAILTLHIAYKPVLVALLLAVIGSAVASGSWKLKGEPGTPLTQNLKRICILLFGPFTILYFFHAWAPETSPDGSGYHLGYVARYLRARGFERITTDMYATLSQGIEMLYVPAFAIGQHSAAALVHFAFTAALALAMFAYGRRLGKPWVGAAGAFLTFASPVVGMDGSTAYIDLGVTAVVFSCFYWLEIWDETQDGKLLIPIGLMAGYSYAAKYPAAMILIFALGFVAIRSRRLGINIVRPVATVVLFSSLMIAPWMVKNWIVVRNPIAPFGNTIFRNPNFHPIFETEYSAAMRDYGVANKWTLPLEVTIRGEKTQGLLGLTFLLAPLALLALRFRHGRRLLAAGAMLGATYYFNIGARFLIPALPFISIAMAMAFEGVERAAPALLGALMVFHGVASWPDEVRRYADKYVWRLDHILAAPALRLIPQEQYLRQKDGDYAAARLVEATVPKGERILGLAGVAYSYSSREFLIGYQAALNQTLVDSMNIGWVSDYQPVAQLTFPFPERTVRRMRVLQTGTVDNPQVQWSIHELRFFHRGVELPRRPEWRLQAWPNPWEVQLAFDNSPATRWRTWEHAKPGDYVDVDFGKDEAVDEVRMETSPDVWVFQLQVEILDSAGNWQLVAKDPKVEAIKPKSSLRLSATYELKAHGIHYFVTGDDSPGADDFRDDPAAWGLTRVASGYGIEIYKVTL